MTEIQKKSPVITEYPNAPVPTKWTKANRQNPITQGYKFIMMCINIMMMVIKGHDH